jgi:HAE1 family hydrophobic/amphiphilic exporter-1
MNIVDVSIKKPVLTTMALLACVVFGGLAYFSIPVSLFPDVKVPMVTVQTVYAGASPQVIESQITKKIEDKVSSISNLDYITSYSMDSVSVILIAFNFGVDENQVLQEVKDKVEVLISELPADAKRPAISKIDISSQMPVMNLVMEGELEATELYTFGQTVVSDRLSQVDGVGSVSLSGGQEREIRVELDRSTVFTRSVALSQIGGILAAANVEIPGGNVKIENMDIPVRLKGEFNSLDEIRDLDVPTANGLFKLHQLADVRDATKTVRERTILLDKKAGSRNENALLLKVVKNPTANTIDVVEGVMKQLPLIQEETGGRVTLKVIKEDATFVRDSVNDTLSNVYLGILFTGIVLLIFLHDLRSTLIVALAMPFSIIATFLVMKAMGISLNMLSLMGLSSATGTLVANSVVVLENIFRHKELGHDRMEAASRGTKEVIVAVFASTLTNVAVFVPLANMSGVMGSVLSNFAYTIVISTVFSIIVSFTLTPLLASRILPSKVKQDGPIGRALEAMFKSWERGYKATLAFILKNRRRSFAVVGLVLVLFMVSMGLFTKVKFELAPNTDGGKVLVNVELPQGNTLEATAAVMAKIEAKLAKYEEVDSLLTSLGTMGSLDSDVSVAQMNVFLVPKADRKESNSEIASRIMRDVSDIPGANIRVSPVSEIQMASGGAVSFNIRGADNDVLLDSAEKVLQRVSKVPGIMNPALSSKSGKAEFVFTPDRKRLSEDGLSVQAVAVTLRAAVDGLVMTNYKEGGEEYDMRVVLKDAALLSIEDIKNIPIVTPSGTQPLSRYADISMADGYSKIMRNDKVRTVQFSADLLPGYTQGAVTAEVMKAAKEVQLPAGYEIKTAGSTEALTKIVTDLIMVFVIAVVLTYMLLAGTLESVTQPIFILATVPLGLIGVVLGCLLTGTVLNFVAMLGIIMLVGIVVNNAILILDYYNQLRRDGATPHDALLEACPTKLKPILMSNIAIVLGMLPMAMGIGASGAEMRAPMGVVIIGGIASSTVMTLWLIPSLEYLLTRVRKPAAVKES